MSKFSKPKSGATVTETDIDRVIEGADAVDDRAAVKTEEVVLPRSDADDVRFTMTLAGDMASRVDRARKAAGGMTRLSWIRLAVAEKLARDGV
jgi:hypothetical protein